MLTIAPVVAVLEDPPAAISPVSSVAPSILSGVAIALFAVIFVLTVVVKCAFSTVKTLVGPLFKILGVLIVATLLLVAALFAGAGSRPAPTQSFTTGSLVAARE